MEAAGGEARTGASRGPGPWVRGGTIPALLLMAYHTQCFGVPWRTSYSSSLINPLFAEQNTFTWPTLHHLADITFRPYRGFFYCCPVFSLLMLAFAHLREAARKNDETQRGRYGGDDLRGASSSFPAAYGGACIGQRYFVAALPCAILVLIPVVKIAPRLFGLLSCWTATLMLVATLVQPLVSEKSDDPFRQVLFPRRPANHPPPHV